MKSSVYAIILNYNKPEDTVGCATALSRSRHPAGFHLLVVDNGPKNLQSFFQKNIPGCVYIKSPGNIGFAAGNNQGIRYALAHAATDILIVNPDVRVGKNFLSPLLQLFAAHPRAGLVAPAHTEREGSYGLGGRVDWRLASFPHTNVTSLKGLRPRRFDLLTFACVLIRAEVFASTGLMDESYFLYLEDVDYCVSAARASWELWLDPSVVVHHATSSSFADPRGKIKYSFRSSFIFIKKWLRFPHNLVPLIHTLYFYPKLYLLWTAQRWKRRLITR